MGLLRDIVDVVTRGAVAEMRWRRENPAAVAAEFRAREVSWESRGRSVLARIAGRRAARWEVRARKALPS